MTKELRQKGMTMGKVKDYRDGFRNWLNADRPTVSEDQRKLDASCSEKEAAEYVRKERGRNANCDKPYPVPRDGFINDYD